MPPRVSPPRRIRTIGVQVPQSIGFARAVFRGITQFVREDGGWALEPVDAGALAYYRASRRKLDALVTFLSSETDRRLAEAAARRVVNVSNRQRLEPPVPTVCNDDVAIGAAAGRFFAERRFRTVCFAAIADNRLVAERLEGLRAVGDPGAFRVLRLRWRSRAGLERELRRAAGLGAAVFAVTDEVALTVLRVARQSGLSVPSDFPVLGVDNDECLAYAELVGLSSIAPQGEQIGLHAARIAAGRGPLRAGWRESIGPSGVVERASTETVASTDEAVRRSVTWLHNNLAAPFDPGALCRHAGVGRRTLERRLRAELGVTPAGLLEGMRVRVAKRLLVETDLPLEAVADQSGFGSALQCWRVFKQMEGCAPGEYRARSIRLFAAG